MSSRLIAPWAARLHTMQIRDGTHGQHRSPPLGATGVFITISRCAPSQTPRSPNATMTRLGNADSQYSLINRGVKRV